MLTNNKVSDLDIGIDVITPNSNEENSLQRTENWREQRRGNWTGSQFKNCMTCSPVGGKLDWTDKRKVFHFSSGSIKYIYSNAMERKTGRYIETDSTKEMRYGTIIEKLIERRFSEWLKERSNLKFELVGYKEFEHFKTAGVSSDGVLKDENGNVVASVEFKSCSSWGAMYDRTYDKTDESSKDFWQTQGQMLAWNVSENYYVVISPPQDINLYLRAENVMDFYDDWVNETEMNVEVIEKSEIHLNALRSRLEIMETTVNRWLEEENPPRIGDILYQVIDEFKDLEKGEPTEKEIKLTKILESPKIISTKLDEMDF